MPLQPAVAQGRACHLACGHFSSLWEFRDHSKGVWARSWRICLLSDPLMGRDPHNSMVSLAIGGLLPWTSLHALLFAQGPGQAQ